MTTTLHERLIACAALDASDALARAPHLAQMLEDDLMRFRAGERSIVDVSRQLDRLRNCIVDVVEMRDNALQPMINDVARFPLATLEFVRRGFERELEQLAIEPTRRAAFLQTCGTMLSALPQALRDAAETPIKERMPVSGGLAAGFNG